MTSNVIPADTLEFFRLKRALRPLRLPLDMAVFSALREAFVVRRGRQPHTPHELAEYYAELSERDRVTELLREYGRE